MVSQFFSHKTKVTQISWDIFYICIHCTEEDGKSWTPSIAMSDTIRTTYFTRSEWQMTLNLIPCSSNSETHEILARPCFCFEGTPKWSKWQGKITENRYIGSLARYHDGIPEHKTWADHFIWKMTLWHRLSNVHSGHL